MKKRVLALLMCGALVATTLSSTALADVWDGTAEQEEGAVETVVEDETVSTEKLSLNEEGETQVVANPQEDELIPTEETAVTVDADQVIFAAEADAQTVEPEQAALDDSDSVDIADSVTYTVTEDDVTVEVEAPVGALPDGAVLTVTRYAEDSDEYEEAAEAINYEIVEENTMAALDISFQLDGEEVEPTEAVQVRIDVSELLTEDADASTLEIQHLEGKRFGRVKPVLVATAAENDAVEGTIDEKTAVAEFTVDGFSAFTVTWSDNTTIAVHVYNMDGIGINEYYDHAYEEKMTNDTIVIQDLLDDLEQDASYTNVYTFQYATVYVETSEAGGATSTQYGSLQNSLVSLSKNGTNYTYILTDGTTGTVDGSYLINIHLYYSVPILTLDHEDISSYTDSEGNVYTDLYLFTTTSEYFTYDTDQLAYASGTVLDIIYSCVLSDENIATVVEYVNEDETGQTNIYSSAYVAWTDEAQAGDQVTVTMTKIVFYSDGTTETASDMYTMTYGTQSLTVTVQNGTTAQAGAQVALLDPTTGETVATGTTGTDGTVTFDVPEGTYTVGVTYVSYTSTGMGSVSRYTGTTSATVGSSGGTATVTLGSVSGTEYEHMDVKIAVAGSEENDLQLAGIDRVYIYDEYGNLIYYTNDIVENTDTTDFNCLFGVNNGTEAGASAETHSIVVTETDTIVIIYETYDPDTGTTHTYTATFPGGGTYADGDYYPYNFPKAYQLYNYLYGGSYTSNEELQTAYAAGQLDTACTAAGIPISGMTYVEIAEYLCDSAGTAQAGLDFVIDATPPFVQYDMRLGKTYEVDESYDPNHGSEGGSPDTFTFALQKVASVDDDLQGSVEDGWDFTELYTWTVDSSAETVTASTTGNWTQNDDGSWSCAIDYSGMENFLTYEAEEGTHYFYYILYETDAGAATPEAQYYGIRVAVQFSYDTGLATLVTSYCVLTYGGEDADGNAIYYRDTDSLWIGMTENYALDENGQVNTLEKYFSMSFTNVLGTYEFSLDKVDDTGTSLEGAVFHLYDSEGYIISFDYTEGTDGNPDEYAYDNQGTTTDITVGSAVFTGFSEGTYTLKEVSAPDGYVHLTEDITFTLSYVTDDVTGESGVQITIVYDDETVDAEQDHVTVAADENGNMTIITVANDTNYNTASISGEKVWDDANNQDGIRPASITVYLTKLSSDGETYERVQDENGNDISVTTSASENWAWSFTELPLYEKDDDGNWNDVEVIYSVEEGDLTYPGGYTGVGYTTEVTTDDETGYVTITNSYTPETIDITGTKAWDFEGYDFTYYPDSITIRLLADGTEVTSQTVTGAGDNWTWSFTDLPKYKDGTEIVYTVTEDEVDHFTSSGDGDSSNDYTITNTFIPETVDLTVEKVWKDNDDPNGDQNSDRPESITIQLTANGDAVEGETLTLDGSNDWKGSFTNLVKYDYTSGAVPYEYSVTEVTDDIEDIYTPSYSELTDNGDGTYSITVTNTHKDYREYFPIDEEIVVDESNTGTWVKNEAVNEYNAIELEMATLLPHFETPSEVLTEDSAFTMNFHEVLDSQLNLDETDADFSVYIGTTQVDHKYYTVTISPDDDCTFHVDVDLTQLYLDGVIDDDDLQGDTVIMIFFYADLEGTGLNGSYTSTVWYDVYNGDTWEYTSNVDVVSVYTYEVEILKYDASTLSGTDYAGSGLAGATLGIYYDAACTDPVYRYVGTGFDESEKLAYTVTSEEDGYAIFYGLADGTYYVKETEAPAGYVLSDEVLAVTLTDRLVNSNYTYEAVYANAPEGWEPSGGTGGNGGGTNTTHRAKTSDADTLGLWILLMVSGALFATAGGVLHRKSARARRR